MKRSCRGSLAELAERTSAGVLGEITLVVEGAAAAARSLPPAEVVAAVRLRVRAGSSRKDAIAAVADELGVRKRDVYAAAVGGQRRLMDPPASRPCGALAGQLWSAATSPLARSGAGPPLG